MKLIKSDFNNKYNIELNKITIITYTCAFNSFFSFNDYTHIGYLSYISYFNIEALVKTVKQLINEINKGYNILYIEPFDLIVHPKYIQDLVCLISVLSKSDIKIVVQTNNDFFLKEINNLIMLSRSDKKIQNKYKFKKKYFLDFKDVSVYTQVSNEEFVIELVEESVNQNGYDIEHINKVIMSINDKSDVIYYSLPENKG